LVLDLGEQPACDYFPEQDDPGPDPRYPLQMWLCSSCGLAQLLVDPTIPEEPRGKEPAALVAQAADAVARVAAAGLLPPRARVAEFGSPHGGSWLEQLACRGLVCTGGDEAVDVVLDCFGMMHAPDQAAGLRQRAARVAPGGVLLLQYHSLDTIVRLGQWNALRHGHYAYYSTAALVRMLETIGFRPRRAWRFELYGGTVLLAASREADGPLDADASVAALVEAEALGGAGEPGVVGGLQVSARRHAAGLHDWLVAERTAGRTVVGYGAASRAVSLLLQAGVDATLLPAVVDASPAKRGHRMPGTDIPIVAPSEIAWRRPSRILLFVPDLLAEVRRSFADVEASGGRWVNAETVRAWPPLEAASTSHLERA